MEYFKVLIKSQNGKEIIFDPFDLDDTHDIREWAKLGSKTSNAIINQVKSSPKEIYIIGDYVQVDRENIIHTTLANQRRFIRGEYQNRWNKIPISEFIPHQVNLMQKISENERKLWGEREDKKRKIPKLNTNPPLKAFSPCIYTIGEDGSKYNKYSIVDLSLKTYQTFLRHYIGDDELYNPIIIECIISNSIKLAHIGILAGHLLTLAKRNDIEKGGVYSQYYSSHFSKNLTPIYFT